METLTALGTGLSDSNELFELAASDDDDATLESIELDANGFQEKLEALEFRRMFSNPADPLNCFLTSRLAPAARKRRTGPRCCCAST